MSRPTAAQLLARLREVYAERDGKPLSDEKLAGRLPITLSTFNRWKKADTKAFSDIVQMLDEVGWLNTDVDAPAAESSLGSPLEETIAELALGQAVLLDHFGLQIEVEPHEESEPRKPDHKPNSLP